MSSENSLSPCDCTNTAGVLMSSISLLYHSFWSPSPSVWSSLVFRCLSPSLRNLLECLVMEPSPENQVL